MAKTDRYGLLDDPKVKKLDKLPEGWKYMRWTLTEPNGWAWAYNGESITSGLRERALVRNEDWLGA